ncbi:MAG: hypothetical protein CM1200mP41_14750 [Gammaproteobacteria bacterium]|nr:MAG: hypothetical protein CM1200mP41_14750 [Gammaproteobacteria bacterium]
MTKPLCVVVGVGPGNGASFTRRFLRDGYRVAVLARDSTYLESLSTSLSECYPFPCDVRNTEELNGTLTSLTERLGPTSVLIYNAGAGEWRSPEETTVEGFESSWRTNALGLLVSSQAVLKGYEGPRPREYCGNRCHGLKSGGAPPQPLLLQRRRHNGAWPSH